MNKKRFLTFLFSLIPGCGLMYLGYMKRGLQFMIMFAAVFAVGAFFESAGINLLSIPIFIILPIIWFYQMFDAMHTISRMKNMDIGIPEDDGYYLPGLLMKYAPTQNKKSAKIIAIILIAVGSYSLVMGILNGLMRYDTFGENYYYHLVYSSIRNNLIPAVIAVALIVIGVKLLNGSKSKKTNDEDGEMK